MHNLYQIIWSTGISFIVYQTTSSSILLQTYNYFYIELPYSTCIDNSISLIQLVEKTEEYDVACRQWNECIIFMS